MSWFNGGSGGGFGTANPFQQLQGQQQQPPANAQPPPQASTQPNPFAQSSFGQQPVGGFGGSNPFTAASGGTASASASPFGAPTPGFGAPAAPAASSTPFAFSAPPPRKSAPGPSSPFSNVNSFQANAKAKDTSAPQTQSQRQQQPTETQTARLDRTRKHTPKIRSKLNDSDSLYDTPSPPSEGKENYAKTLNRFLSLKVASSATSSEPSSLGFVRRQRAARPAPKWAQREKKQLDTVQERFHEWDMQNQQKVLQIEQQGEANQEQYETVSMRQVD